MNQFIEHYHLSEEQLLRIVAGTAQPEELDRWMEHIAQCDRCALRLAELTERGSLLEVTPLFEENVTRRVAETSEEGLSVVWPKRTEGRSIERTRRPERTPKILRNYSFKVVLAACATLMLMNAGMFGVTEEGATQRTALLDRSKEPLQKITREWKDASQRWESIFEEEFTL